MSLLIDGHNLIGQLPDLSLADADDEEQLLARLQTYRRRRPVAITVVFDPGSGYSPFHGRGERRAGIRVIYAPPGLRADDLLIDLLRQARDRRGCTLVTSDRALQAEARSLGATIMSSAEFGRQLAAAQSPPPEPDPREQPLSPAEVEQWLRLFSQRRGRPRS